MDAGTVNRYNDTVDLGGKRESSLSPLNPGLDA